MIHDSGSGIVLLRSKKRALKKEHRRRRSDEDDEDDESSSLSSLSLHRFIALSLHGRKAPGHLNQDVGKGVLSFRAVAFHDGFWRVLESTLPTFCLSYKLQHNEATVAVLTVLAVLAVMATPLKLNPPLLWS